LQADPARAALAAVVQRIVAGERESGLVNGLDEHDTTIVAEVLRQLAPADNRQRTD
jgi:hypothetical protein